MNERAPFDKYAAAVNAKRNEGKDSLDNFFTPLFGCRALMEFLNSVHLIEPGMTALEPACGLGHIGVILQEHFDCVTLSDIVNWEGREFVLKEKEGIIAKAGNHVAGKPDLIHDFLDDAYPINEPMDWVITNPPFNKAMDFVLKGLTIAKRGVAVLVRTAFIESKGRYENLFKLHPPKYLLQFSERIGMTKGTVDADIASSVSYCWLIWLKGNANPPEIHWVPPGSRKRLEKSSDYPDSDKMRKSTSAFIG